MEVFATAGAEISVRLRRQTLVVCDTEKEIGSFRQNC